MVNIAYKFSNINLKINNYFIKTIFNFFAHEVTYVKCDMLFLEKNKFKFIKKA